MRRLYYKYKQGKRNQGRRGEAGYNEIRKHDQSRRRQQEGYKADDGNRRAERRGVVKQNQPHHEKDAGVVRRKKPVFVTKERRLKAPKLKAVMEERSSDSRLTDSRLDSRLASEIDSKPKLTFTDSKPDSEINSKLNSNSGLSAAEPARSQPTRGNAKKKKSTGKVICTRRTKLFWQKFKGFLSI